MAGGIKYYFQEGGRIVAQPQSNAHENIDNIIAMETIKRIAHASKGNYMEGYYEAETEGGDKRHILRKANLMGTPENLEWMDAMLRGENPLDIDTTRTSDVQEVLEGMRQLDKPTLLQRLFKGISNR